MIGYFYRFERGAEDKWSEDIGPVPEFFQLTYEDLRIGPDGEIVAQFDGGYWYDVRPGADKEYPWSDIVMWAKEIPG